MTQHVHKSEKERLKHSTNTAYTYYKYYEFTDYLNIQLKNLKVDRQKTPSILMIGYVRYKHEIKKTTWTLEPYKTFLIITHTVKSKKSPKIMKAISQYQPILHAYFISLLNLKFKASVIISTFYLRKNFHNKIQETCSVETSRNFGYLNRWTSKTTIETTRDYFQTRFYEPDSILENSIF